MLLLDLGLLGKLWGNPLNPNIYVMALVDQVCMHLIQNKIFTSRALVAFPSLPDIQLR